MRRGYDLHYRRLRSHCLNRPDHRPAQGGFDQTLLSKGTARLDARRQGARTRYDAVNDPRAVPTMGGAGSYRMVEGNPALGF